jgi:hypothetical protein
VTTVLVVLIGVILPFTPQAAILGLVPLPGAYFVFLGGVTITYLLLVEVVKRRLMRQLLGMAARSRRHGRVRLGGKARSWGALSGHGRRDAEVRVASPRLHPENGMDRVMINLSPQRPTTRSTMTQSFHTPSSCPCS